ncbi:KpsF/GutQ family sugar-phosphate isomerase [Hyphomicrobium methylovorum]|uniref:KpsF/GutQ family sugar-phosphate isomerase n=1 Tax=Hyphomicrobium methylovorum TaxID=84 RepID=UPI0015E71F62|nr:KpsF/GutQ family sugar-phosphate isomerase [Hyphomicrobium methylovorum]MBA2126793.1 KpsF/GutQ family sugar-phosphate isomerase [Hyphomicrobium methylovorum]
MQKVVPFPRATAKNGAAAVKRRTEAPVASAVRTLNIETEGLALLAKELDGPLAPHFNEAVQRLAAVKGRVIITGVGKSGHVGQKIAATFASTGTPAFFVHPTEASHGDLGMVTPADIILALSWSGETLELKPIITYSRRFAVPLVAITSQEKSALGQHADVLLLMPAAKEACPHGLAPTTSTTMQLALGDSLAIALLEARGFTANDFKIFHPGGSLGANLKYVSDIMHRGDRLPLIKSGASMAEALVSMTEKSFGCVGVLNRSKRLIGVITDGDLRRHMRGNLLQAKVDDIMTAKPKTIRPEMLASAALELINSSSITALFVVQNGKPVGLIHVHDLLRLGVA